MSGHPRGLSATEDMKRVKRILRILAVNAAVLAVGIVVVELAFGGWLGARRLNRLHIIRDRVLEYDVSDLYTNPTGTITYSRDEYGLRGSHSTPESIDILTVGGSTTDQHYIGDGETWQDALQQRFEEAGAIVIVANAGIDGQSTFGHIKNFKWWFPHIPGLAPDIILFYVGVNDFHTYAGRGYDDLLREDGSASLRRRISANSALANLVRTVRGTWQAMVVQDIGHNSTDFANLEWTRQGLQDDYEFMQPRLRAYADRLRVLAEVTRDFGAEPVFVSQPSRRYRVTPGGVEGDSRVRSYGDREINGVDFYHMMRRFDAVDEAVASEEGVVFIDVASHADWEDADFYDLVHMTPRGAEKVGAILYEALRSVVAGAVRTAPHGAGEHQAEGA